MAYKCLKGDLASLPAKRQRKICKCSTRCNNFITIVADEDVIMCEGEAREYAYDILRTLGLYSDVYQKPKALWTTKDEQFIIKYYAEHGSHNGAYEIIGRHLGRSREAVKRRITRMRKEKRLV